MILMLVSCQKNLSEPVAVSGVSLNAESVELEEGENVQLIATVSPKNADNKAVIWSSSNLSIAAVSDGKVTALKVGRATITVKTDDGSKTATCAVTVNAKVYPVTGVTLDKTSYEMTEGDDFTLTATVNPSNATNKNVTWSSNDQSVASVVNGKVTAIKEGKAMITVKTEDGSKTATCAVTVNAKVYPVTGVTLDKTSYEMTEGDDFTLTATVNPSNATNKNVTWSSSDQSVASVVNGKVTALKAGKAMITVRTEDGGKTATCSVTVNAKVYPVTGVTLDKTSYEMTEGDDFTLTATVNPSNATNKNVTWSSSDQSVASVVNGKVTALKAGKAMITVRTEDGGKTATCDIAVTEPTKATSLTLDNNWINGYIYRDHSRFYSISVSAYPEDAVTDYEWTSSDTRVAKVNAYGNNAYVYTEDYGESIITVTDKRTGISASMTIHTVVEDFKWEDASDETLYGYPQITILLGEEHKLKYSHTPSSATKIFSDLDQFVFYENNRVVDTPSCISITEDGIIKGVKTGIVGIKPTGCIIGAPETGRIYINVISDYTESEYNDEMAYADIIKPGQKMKFRISDSNDIDIFKFTSPVETFKYFDIKITYEGYAGDPYNNDKHVRYEMYNDNVELFGSGNITFKPEGSVYTIASRFLNTTQGYIRFSIQDYWKAYPSAIPIGDFTIEFVPR